MSKFVLWERGACHHAACAMIENDLNILALLCQSAAGGDEEFWGIIDQVSSASHYERLCDVRYILC